VSRSARRPGYPRQGAPWWLLVAIGAILLLARIALGAAPAAGDINVVANASVSTNELPLAALRSMFLMRATVWPEGGPVTVFVLPDRDDIHVAFCTKVLKTFPYVLRDIWDRGVFTGTGRAPTEVANQQELLRRVAATPGAIGYFQGERVPDEKTKLLHIR
jgi:hypothetical protein